MSRAARVPLSYHLRMRIALVLALVGGAAPTAFADSFGGFSGIDRAYLVNQDRVCTPLAVANGAATGAATCRKAPADELAKLDFKAPIVQRGDKAQFAATASGSTLTVTGDSGAPVATWKTADPIGKVVDVYASQYADRVAVVYTVRRLGRELTEVVAFDVATAKPSVTVPIQTPAATPTTDHTDSPDVAKKVADARAAARAQQLAAWQAVLALDSDHSEALFHVAAMVAPKQPRDALVELDRLAGTKRSDAIDWLVEARFDPAFATLRADPKFRAAVGLDRKPTSTYERVMGFGGQWEQTGTSCDRAEVKLVLTRDRAFKLHVKMSCEGQASDLPFKGMWRVEGDEIVLTLPTRGAKATAKDEAPCVFEKVGEDDAMRCVLDKDLEFLVLPTRR